MARMCRCAVFVVVGLLVASNVADMESGLACDVNLQIAVEEEESGEDGPAAISLLQRRGAGHIVTSSVSVDSFGAQATSGPELPVPRPSGSAAGLAVVATSASKRGSVETSSSVVHAPPKSCNKLTGGTCLWSPCDESRAATCDHRSLCVCPEFTCSDGAGRCVLSAAEIRHAAREGVLGVKEKVSHLISTLPGLADSLHGPFSSAFSGDEGAVHHIVESAGDALDELIGEGECKTMVGTCVFSDCPTSVSLTAVCTYGVCNCKPDFCYAEVKGKYTCIPNISKLYGQR